MEKDDLEQRRQKVHEALTTSKDPRAKVLARIFEKKVQHTVYEKNDPRFATLELKDQIGHILEDIQHILSKKILVSGEQVGVVRVRSLLDIPIAVPQELADTSYAVVFISLQEDIRHKGLGKMVYEKLAIWIQSAFGKKLVSDPIHLSDDALAMWESLERAGKARKTPHITAEGHPIYEYLAKPSEALA